jgi:hypothetical protein
LPRDPIPGAKNVNGLDTNGYHWYYICFHISIRIQIRMVSTMSDRIRLDIDIINMRFEYLDTNKDTVSHIEYLDSVKSPKWLERGK